MAWKFDKFNLTFDQGAKVHLMLVVQEKKEPRNGKGFARTISKGI